MPTVTVATAGPAPLSEQRRVFEAAFAEYYPRVRAALAARVGDWHTADDLAQATFTRMWRHVAAGQVDLTRYEVGFAWLMGWARHTTLKHHTANPARVEHATSPAHLPGTPAVRAAAVACDPGMVVADRVHTAGLLTGVPDHARAALALHVLDDLPTEQIAATIGTSHAEAAALIEAGTTRVRELLGVTGDQIRAHNQATARQAARRHLTAAARTPAGRPAAFRRALVAAITDGTYPPGTALPPANALAAAHAPAGATPVSRDREIVSLILHTLHRKGILAAAPTTGYTVTDHGARLAADWHEPVPARTALARDLLAGTWAPGTQLPSASALARRWHCDPKNVNALLDRFAAADALIRTPDGCYYTTPEPGTDFTPTGRPHTPTPHHRAAVRAAVIDQAQATGRIPTIQQISDTHNVGRKTATRARAAAIAATGLQPRTGRSRRDTTAIQAAVIDQAQATGRIPTIQQISDTHHVGQPVAIRARDAAAAHTGLPLPTVRSSQDIAAIQAAVIDQAHATGRIPTLRQIRATHHVGHEIAARAQAAAVEHTGRNGARRHTSRDIAAIQAAVIHQTQTTGRIPTIQQVRDTYHVSPNTAVRLRHTAAHHAGLPAPTARGRARWTTTTHTPPPAAGHALKQAPDHDPTPTAADPQAAQDALDHDLPAADPDQPALHEPDDELALHEPDDELALHEPDDELALDELAL